MQSNENYSETIKHYIKTGEFKNKKVILTGATGGIGSSILKSLLLVGAKVVVLIRNLSKLPIATTLSDYSKKEQLMYQIVDLSNPIQINEAMNSALIKFQGELDTLILCHGIFISGGIEQITTEDYDNNININVRSYFHLLSLSIPFLKLTKGNVVVMSSIEAKIIEKGCFLHSLSKSIINSMVQCTALELAPSGVRINAVAPSFVKTKLRSTEDIDEEANENLLMQMGNYGLLSEEPLDPGDISNCVLFLASNESYCMTGEIVNIDNGFELNHDLSFKGK